MEFRHLYVVDPSTYNIPGFCDGISVRVHKDRQVEDVAIIDVQRDLRGNAKPLPVSLHSEYSVIPVMIPECLPERLYAVSYVNEFSFLKDDVFDEAEGEERDNLFSEMLAGLQGKQPSMGGTPETKRQMMKIDKERAAIVLSLWVEFLEKVRAGREFDDLDDYLAWRIDDVGKPIWSGCMIFGMALAIPDDEKEICSDLTRPPWTVLVLTNDYFSWDKEHSHAEAAGKSYFSNALRVIMRERLIGLEEAKNMCRASIQRHVKEYLDVVNREKKEKRLSRDVVCFTEALLYTISGNAAWSVSCPRYNPDAHFSAEQMQLIARAGDRPEDDVAKSGQVFASAATA
ncbi:hypothetical protein OQA88_2204 [Cercophora sp. LCS_1]